MSEHAEDIRIEDYDYQLPPERIAAHPLTQRASSKLLVYQSGQIRDESFDQLARQVPEGSLLVFNNTRVIEARIFFQKPSGGNIEIFCLEPFEAPIGQALAQTGSVSWQCLIGGASKWKPGQLLQKQVVADGQPATLTVAYVSKLEDSFVVQFDWQPAALPFVSILHAAGDIPLPPYIKRAATAEDAERYQTVFATEEGSVAAPTAALHFTPGVLEELREKKIDTAFVTLHVGAGTFKPVKSETLGGHHMHGEPFTVTRAALQDLLNAPRTIAVGTTSLRTLESLHWIGVKLMHGLLHEPWSLGQWEAYELEKKFPGTGARQSLQALIGWLDRHNRVSLSCRTSLLIAPGYRFRIPAALITNFHQPQSTLLLLISAFIGPAWKKLYAHALANGYRFLSYGDSSLLWRPDPASDMV